jgi:hypothetical protein
MGLNKLNTIADLLDGKGIILVRSDDVKGQWYVHCWWDTTEFGGLETHTDIHNTYTTDLEKELDIVIAKLEERNHE